MTDTVGAIHDFNPVSHVRYKGQPSYVSLTSIQTVGPGNTYAVLGQGYLGVDSLASIASALPAYPSDRMTDAAYDAFIQASQQIPEQVSVPNFLYELREVKELIPKLQGIVKSIANGYLSIEFGWKPFLSDLRKISQSVAATRKRIAQLRAGYGRVSTLHTSRTLIKSEYEPPSRDYDDDANSVLDGLSEKYTQSYQAVFRTTIEYYHTIEGLDRVDAFLKAYLTATGWTNSPKVIWNAIPWSWLLDWFVNLDSFFDSFHEEPFKGKIEIRNVGYSVKEIAVVEVGMYVNSSYSPGRDTPKTWMSATSYFLERYTRINGLPLSGSLFNTEHDAHQLAILTAILAARK
jgi:hypothetical protein